MLNGQNSMEQYPDITLIEDADITLLHEFACNNCKFCMSGACGHSFHKIKPKASENAVHECNNCNMHANKCNKMLLLITGVVSLLTQNTTGVTRRSNALILIKAHHGC